MFLLVEPKDQGLDPGLLRGCPYGGANTEQKCEWVGEDEKEARPLGSTHDLHPLQWWPEPGSKWASSSWAFDEERASSLPIISGDCKEFWKADWCTRFEMGPRAPRRRAAAQQPGFGRARRWGSENSSWLWALTACLALFLALGLLLLVECGQWPHEAGAFITFRLWMIPWCC